MVQGRLHLCQGRYLHYHSEGIDDRVPVQWKPNVRAQANRIVRTVLQEWKPAKVFIGTGNPDSPEIIGNLTLPNCWEGLREVQMKAPRKKRSGKR
jgi:hypothetical protein